MRCAMSEATGDVSPDVTIRHLGIRVPARGRRGNAPRRNALTVRVRAPAIVQPMMQDERGLTDCAQP